MNQLTIKELSDKLNELVERGVGDYEIHLDIKDYYNTPSLATMRKLDNSVLNSNVFVNNDRKTVWFVGDLRPDSNNSNPKITYRKA